MGRQITIKLIVLTIAIVVLHEFAIGQAPFPDLNNAKKIALLSSSRYEVIAVLESGSPFISDSPYFQSFSREDANVDVWYSSGKCSDSSDDSEFLGPDVWNVNEGKVIKIRVSPKGPIRPSDLGIDISKFRKERLYRSSRNYYVFHDKESGIAITVRGNGVYSIELFPSKKEHALLCSSEAVRKYYSSKKWRFHPQPKHQSVDFNYPPNVVNLVLSQTENDPRRISVITNAEDAENDVLTYVYKITGGNIVGVGARVVWDLSGVEPGTYKITVAADDGCGICGKFITKTVVVKE